MGRIHIKKQFNNGIVYNNIYYCHYDKYVLLMTSREIDDFLCHGENHVC